MKSFRGFKRFDDESSQKEDRRVKLLSTKRRSKRDQSVLPFLTYEDSNGMSPINEVGRWETLERDESKLKDQNGRDPSSNTVTNSLSSKFPLKNGENITRQEIPAKILPQNIKDRTRRKSSLPSKAAVSSKNVFDPFCLEDLENQSHCTEFFDLTGSEWDTFSHNPSAIEQEDFTKMVEKAFVQTDDLFSHLEVGGVDKIKGKDRSPVESETDPRRESDAISFSSFPMRIKPIDFLKKRTVEEDDSYAGDIFLQFDPSSHHGRTRPSMMESTILAVQEEEIEEEEEEEGDETNDDEAESSSPSLQLETEIQPEEGGIEVVDIETIASSAESSKGEGSASLENPPPQQKEDTDLTIDGRIERQTYDSNETKTEETDLWDSSMGEDNARREFVNHGDTPPPDSIAIQANESIGSETVEPSMSTSHEQQVESSDQEGDSADINPLQQLAKFVTPILNVRPMSLSQDDSAKLAAKNPGMTLTEESVEEEVRVPLNVKIKRNSDHTRSTSQHQPSHSNCSEVSKRTKESKRMMSPSTGSLLDNVTEVSDLHSSTTSSHSTMDPKLQLETIDLKSLRSGSVSALSFQGKLFSNGSEDESSAVSKGRKKPLPSIKIPRGPTRRKESDFASVAKEPKQRTANKKHNGSKPLGASSTEIKMINKFLAIAGPEFDGTHLSIEKREQIHNKALRAGLTETFINKMLDQSAGILSWDQISAAGDDQNAKAVLHSPSGSTRTGRTIQTKDTADDATKTTLESSFSEDFTYDEDGFVRKTPKDDTFNCLRNIFWMESSNVMGDDMTENILAVMSADSESLYSRRQGRK